MPRIVQKLSFTMTADGPKWPQNNARMIFHQKEQQEKTCWQ